MKILFGQRGKPVEVSAAELGNKVLFEVAEIIDELEPVKRGPYAGVVGYVDFSGNLDTAIAIRTMFIGESAAYLQAGAGIVADSEPDDEDLECRNKAAGLLAAIPAARRMTKRRLEGGTKA
jgi:anthranilate synthase component 1